MTQQCECVTFVC